MPQKQPHWPLPMLQLVMLPPRMLQQQICWPPYKLLPLPTPLLMLLWLLRNKLWLMLRLRWLPILPVLPLRPLSMPPPRLPLMHKLPQPKLP